MVLNYRGIPLFQTTQGNGGGKNLLPRAQRTTGLKNRGFRNLGFHCIFVLIQTNTQTATELNRKLTRWLIRKVRFWWPFFGSWRNTVAWRQKWRLRKMLCFEGVLCFQNYKIFVFCARFNFVKPENIGSGWKFIDFAARLTIVSPRLPAPGVKPNSR